MCYITNILNFVVSYQSQHNHTNKIESPHKIKGKNLPYTTSPQLLKLQNWGSNMYLGEFFRHENVAKSDIYTREEKTAHLRQHYNGVKSLVIQAILYRLRDAYTYRLFKYAAEVANFWQQIVFFFLPCLLIEKSFE